MPGVIEFFKNGIVLEQANFILDTEILKDSCVVAFDLLLLNGESILGKKLVERRALLHQNF